tara:strand:+ start:2711 stop:2980 length:270 start_codon:yes stop_codon:yes gene_type:complete
MTGLTTEPAVTVLSVAMTGTLVTSLTSSLRWKRRKMMSRIYKNWPIHNLIAHPVSELAYWIVRPLGKSRAKRVGDWIHDSTLPEEDDDE